MLDTVAGLVNTFVPYNPAGITQVISVGPSPFVYTAGSQPQVIYISAGGVAITSVTKNGQNLSLGLPLTVLLAPGKSVTVTYVQSGSPPSGTPFIVADY